MPKQYKVTFTLSINFGEYSKDRILFTLKKKVEYNSDSVEFKIKDMFIVEINRDKEVIHEGK